MNPATSSQRGAELRHDSAEDESRATAAEKQGAQWLEKLRHAEKALQLFGIKTDQVSLQLASSYSELFEYCVPAGLPIPE